MKALAAKKAPLPLNLPSSRHASIDEAPLTCGPLENYVMECKQAASEASGSYKDVLEEQRALRDQLSSAPKAQEAHLRDAMSALESKVANTRQQKEETKRELKKAEAMLDKERTRMFVRIQSQRNVERARSIAATYGSTCSQLIDDLTEQKELHAASIRQARWETAEAARRKQREETAKAWNGEAREAGWCRIWSFESKVFPPVERVPRTIWKPPQKPPSIDDPITKFKVQLGPNLYKIMQLLKKWDVNFDGEISMDELGLAMDGLAIAYDQEGLKALFEALDTDASGSVSFDELNHAMRKHAPRHLPPNKVCLEMPKRKEPIISSAAAVRRAVHALTLALQAKLGRVSTLFSGECLTFMAYYQPVPFNHHEELDPMFRAHRCIC
jgi:hypothetical protein